MSYFQAVLFQFQITGTFWTNRLKLVEQRKSLLWEHLNSGSFSAWPCRPTSAVALRLGNALPYLGWVLHWDDRIEWLEAWFTFCFVSSFWTQIGKRGDLKTMKPLWCQHSSHVDNNVLVLEFRESLFKKMMFWGDSWKLSPCNSQASFGKLQKAQHRLVCLRHFSFCAQEGPSLPSS